MEEQSVTVVAPQKILSILKTIKWPHERVYLTGQTDLETVWLQPACVVVHQYLQKLAQVEWLPVEGNKERVFPTKEYRELEAALEDLVKPKHSSIAAVVDIKVDDLGMTLYKAHLAKVPGSVASVQGYVAFTEETGWSVLREYLLKAISFEWMDMASKNQFSVLKELMLIGEDVAKDKTTVAKLWKSLSKEFHESISTAPRPDLMATLHEYRKKEEVPFPDAPKVKATPAQRRRQRRRRPKPSSSSTPAPELSLRKRIIYGHRT